MTVKIVTDSLGDIPAEIVKNLDITVIPINVLFGTESFRDGVDITTEQFYDRLVKTKVLPTTAVPALGIFAEAYDKISQKTNEIVVLTVSHKLSATYDTALHATELMKNKCKIKVIDTFQIIMGQGLLTIWAAEAAKSGAKFDEIIKLIETSIPRMDERMAFDTLDYLKRGGRIGAGAAFLGSILKLNPVLGLKDGEVTPIARERSRAKSIEHLFKFATSFSRVDALAVEDATTPEEADALYNRIKEALPKTRIFRSKVSPVIGTHVGPSVIAVSVMGDK